MIIKGDIEGLKTLIPTPPENSLIKKYVKVKNQYKKTGLHIAAEMGYDNIIEFLVQNHAKIEQLDKLERTPLHYAALNGHSVETLIKLGANLSAQDELNRLPIHLATMSGHKQCVKIMLDKNRTLINSKDDFLRTILHYAMFTKGDAYEMTELILKYLPNINEKDRDGFAPIYYA